MNIAFQVGRSRIKSNAADPEDLYRDDLQIRAYEVFPGANARFEVGFYL